MKNTPTVEVRARWFDHYELSEDRKELLMREVLPHMDAPVVNLRDMQYQIQNDLMPRKDAAKFLGRWCDHLDRLYTLYSEYGSPVDDMTQLLLSLGARRIPEVKYALQELEAIVGMEGHTITMRKAPFMTLYGAIKSIAKKNGLT